MLAVIILCSTGASAAALEVCGQAAFQKFNDTRIYSKAFISSCEPGARCRVVTHRLDQAAPLGFSHTFAFQRNTPQSKWQVMLVDVLELADTQAGLALKIDNNAAIQVPANLVSTPGAVNEYALDASITDMILAEAKPGNQISWNYNTRDGEQRNIAFSLIGLSDALVWAECAQQLLVSGKSDPAAIEANKPEFSPPEPGVPVDPVGDSDNNSTDE